MTDDQTTPETDRERPSRSAEVPAREFILTILLLLGFVAAMAVLTLYI